MPMVEDLFKLIAKVLVILKEQRGSWKSVHHSYKEWGWKSQMTKLHPFILQDNLFDEIREDEEIGSANASIVVRILD